jgi:hypothetical protein
VKVASVLGSPKVGVKTGKCKAGQERQVQGQNPAEGLLDKRCHCTIIAQQNLPDGSKASEPIDSSIKQDSVLAPRAHPLGRFRTIIAA